MNSDRWRARLGTGLLVAVGLAGVSPPATLAQATKAPIATDPLSNRTWTSMTNGWGPLEKDRSNGESAEGDGGAPSLNGATCPENPGAPASSDIRFGLNGACKSLMAGGGGDDEAGANGSVVFQVWTDAVKQCDSGVMPGSMPGASAVHAAGMPDENRILGGSRITV